jgi:hypothetical protein
MQGLLVPQMLLVVRTTCANKVLDVLSSDTWRSIDLVPWLYWYTRAFDLHTTTGRGACSEPAFCTLPRALHSNRSTCMNFCTPAGHSTCHQLFMQPTTVRIWDHQSSTPFHHGLTFSIYERVVASIQQRAFLTTINCVIPRERKRCLLYM